MLMIKLNLKHKKDCVQNSVNKLLTYLFLILILSSCSFIGKEQAKKDQSEPNIKEIFRTINPIKEELNAGLPIYLKNFTKGNPFINNLSNNTGNIDFETNFENKKKYSFPNIKEFNFIQPELIFINDGSLISFDGKGNFFKIDDKFKLAWKTNHYSKKEKRLSPVVYFAQIENRLLAADTLSNIFCVDINNGELLWTKKGQSPFNSNIKVFKNRFMVVDYENVIRAFSSKDGKELWKFETENSFIKSQKKMSLVIKGEVLYFINALGDVTALNIEDGSLLWQTPTQSNIIYQNAFSLENSDIIYANNAIYFSNNKNEFFSIDAKSGIIKWKQSVSSNIRPTVIDNFIFSVSEHGYLFVIDDLSGNILRISNILTNIKNKKNMIKPTGFIIAKNKLLLSLNNGRLVKVDIETGLQEKILKIAGSKIERPYIFNNSVYFFKNNSIIKFN